MALQNKSQQCSDSLFKQLDLNNDAVLNFREFVIGFSTFLSQTQSQQIKFLFALIDYDSAQVPNAIIQKELSEEKLVKVLLRFLENFPHIKLSQQHIETMVKREFDHIFESTSSFLFSSLAPEEPAHSDAVEEFDFSPVKRVSKHMKMSTPLSNSPKRALNYQMFHQILVQNDYLLQWL
jgi:hypothetical protein